MDFMLDTHVWYAFSFLIFAVVAWKFGLKGFLNMLDGRINAIRTEIATAENLRNEAQDLLAQYQRKQRDAEKDAKSITESAKKHAEEYRKQAEAELEETMARREKQLTERLKRMEQSAIAEIQKYAADLAVKATSQIITEKLDTRAQEKLVDQSIKDLGKNIH
jgi:F-type H+-transporting ATPase subunit b